VQGVPLTDEGQQGGKALAALGWGGPTHALVCELPIEAPAHGGALGFNGLVSGRYAEVGEAGHGGCSCVAQKV
jgi:hypothetical protein